VKTREALEAFRQRHSIPEDLPPITSDDDLVAWGRQLIGRQPGRTRRNEPLRADRRRTSRSGVKFPGYPESVTPEPRKSAETMTLDELFDDIAARARSAGRGQRSTVSARR
jgi:hypothetical protein